MAYKLGPVRPHVSRVANSLGAQFGIKTIWGWGSGSVPGSDHPKGLALDFMTNNIPNGKAVGDALANYLVANATALGVKYVIWWKRIWNPGSGWTAYTGTSNPHTDHVHVSFNSTPGTGTLPAPGTTPVNNPIVPDSVESLVSVFRDLNRAIQWLTDSDNWIRIGLFGGGFALVFIALIGLPTASTVAGAVKKVVK